MYTVRQLIDRLSTQFKDDMDKEIMILDGSNGGGIIRNINLGPSLHSVRMEDIQESGDNEYRVPGAHIVVIGFGCY